jgi:hypothetical protein
MVGDASDISELDLLAQTQFSNNLMTSAARAVTGANVPESAEKETNSKIFARISAPSIDGADYMAKSNISVPSDIGGFGDQSKRTP